MTLTVHVAIGAMIGQATGNPALAFVSGFISHFLVDIIPHGDGCMSKNFRIFKRKRKQAVAYSLIDGTLAIFLVLFFINTNDISNMSPFTWGIIGSVLPDLLVGLYMLTKIRLLSGFNQLHFYFHDLFIKKHGDISLRWAVFFQVILIFLLRTKI